MDEHDTPEEVAFRVRRQVQMAREWHRRLLLSLRGDEAGDCHPDAARWQRNAYMARARRIRAEFVFPSHISEAA